jgi:hypothetical protein
MTTVFIRSPSPPAPAANDSVDAIPVETLTEIQPSMSKSEHVLNCQWWMFRKLPTRLSGPEARYGIAFHELMAAKLIGDKISTRAVAARLSAEEGEIDPVELKAHVKLSLGYLRDWLRGGNPWKVDFFKRAKARVEQSIAYNVVKKKARACGSPGKGHIYPNVTREEFPGTMDLVIDEIETKKDAPDLIVLDHKTGASCDLPKESGQLKSLTWANSLRMKSKRPVGAIFHSPREGAPYLYADEFSRDELKEHGEKLKTAWGRVGDGSLRPGDWCTTCPAFSICPVHSSALVQIGKTDVGITLTAEEVGRRHEVVSRFLAWGEKYKKEVLQAWVEKNGPAPGPDGKISAMVPKLGVRSLSLSGIVRKLGKVAGEKRIAELDEEGLVERSDRMEFRRINDPGK